MADTKYSLLTAGSPVSGSDQWGANQGGASKVISATAVNTYLLSINKLKPNQMVQDASFTIPAAYSLVVARQHKINSGVILSLGSGAIFRIL